MSERVAILKDHWLACAIYWVAMVVVAVVSIPVYGSWTGRNPVAGFIDLTFVFIPVAAALAYAMELREARQRSSLPRSFRAKRYRTDPRRVGWWIYVFLGMAWSIGGMLWAPDSGFIFIGIMWLMIQLGSTMGEAIFISSRDEPA
jgi:hypothetical protein